MSASQVKTIRFQTGIRRGAYMTIWAIGAFLCIAVALFSYRYFLQTDGAPPLIANNLFRHPWLLVHIAGAATALLVGPVQFSSAVRSRFPSVHRVLGRTYVVACLVGGAAGFVLALGASTGLISTMGFGSLAIASIVTTSLAWRRATQRRFAEHRAWMIRSFALTLAAVTLRLYLPLTSFLPIHFDDAYRAISFLCWIPNLLVAELYLRNATRAPAEFAIPSGVRSHI